MTDQRIAKLQRDIERLCESTKTHPMIITFQDERGRVYFATVGNPSIEWIARAMESFSKRLEENVLKRQMAGTRNPLGI